MLIIDPVVPHGNRVLPRVALGEYHMRRLFTPGERYSIDDSQQLFLARL